MLNIPSPILVFGNNFLSKNVIVQAKKKYNSANWEIIDATNQSPDEIRMLVGFDGFFQEDKIVLIENIPNRKQVREFILDLVKSSTESLKFIIYDSNNFIKIDPKTKSYGKTWGDFVSEIQKMSNSKIVDVGEDFTEKENILCVKFIQDNFKKYGKTIGDNASLMFVDIVGRSRGMLLSEIERISINCPNLITEEFVIENAFPTSKDAVLYQFGNALDSCDQFLVVRTIEKFIASGISPYLLGDIMLKKARWQLAVAHLWSIDTKWYEISSRLMEMGKFPSNIWHDYEKSLTQKKVAAAVYTTVDSRIKYMTETLGMPEDYFEKEIDKKEKVIKDDDEKDKVKSSRAESGECIPLPFMAQQLVDFVRAKIVDANKSKYNEDRLKELVIDRGFDVYFSVSDMYKDMRYNSDGVIQCVHHMARMLINTELNDNGEK